MYKRIMIDIIMKRTFEAVEEVEEEPVEELAKEERKASQGSTLNGKAINARSEQVEEKGEKENVDNGINATKLV